MASNYRIRGHESFGIREGWLTKGLAAVKKDNRLFVKAKGEGADALGVGTNMAKAIRYWLRACGLTTESSAAGTNLTEVGEIISTCDPYLEDIFSLWVIHAGLARNAEQATAWNVFFNQIEASSFTMPELQDMMMERLTAVTGDAKLNKKSVDSDCSVLISMYNTSTPEEKDPEEKGTSPLTELGLIAEEGRVYEKKRPDISRLDPLVVLYIMLPRLREEESIPIDEIAEGYNMPGKLLNINRMVLNDYLDQLQNRQYIIINRTAGLDMVYPGNLPTETELLRSYYERKTENGLI